MKANLSTGYLLGGIDFLIKWDRMPLNQGGYMKEKLSVTVPVELIAQLRDAAKKDDRSLSAMVTVIIKAGLEAKEKAA
jgi:hypothetical protein